MFIVSRRQTSPTRPPEWVDEITAEPIILAVAKYSCVVGIFWAAVIAVVPGIDNDRFGRLGISPSQRFNGSSH